MIAVAVVAVLLGAAIGLYRRHERYAKLRDYHIGKYFETIYEGTMMSDVYHRGREEVDRMAAMSRWHRAMHRKYEYAASHPWLSVPPDPPAPH